MCTHGTEIIVDLPDFVRPDREKRNICLDACIVEQIKNLWANEIHTLGCCCGHGKEGPSVVVEQGHSDEQIKTAIEVLTQADDRHWEVQQWRLCTVGTPRSRKENSSDEIWTKGMDSEVRI